MNEIALVTTAPPPAAVVVAYSSASFMACLMLVLPIMTRARVRNFPSVAVLTTMFVVALIQGVNVLIWPVYVPPFRWQGWIFCDIQANLLVASTILIPGGLVCMFRQTSRSLEPSRFGVQLSSLDKRRTMVFELVFCVLLPVISIPSFFIIQPGRYGIAGIKGCHPIFDPTPLAYLFYLLWTPAIECLGGFYAILATVRLYRHQREIKHLFAGSPGTRKKRSELVKSFTFATLIYLIRFPMELFSFRNATLGQTQPFDWARIHPDDWNQKIRYVPYTKVEAIASYAAVIVAAFLAFVLFGIGAAAKQEIKFIRKLVGLRDR